MHGGGCSTGGSRSRGSPRAVSRTEEGECDEASDLVGPDGRVRPVDFAVAAVRQGDRELNAHGMSWAELAELGKELWADASLSGAGATSCATCHTGDGTGMMNASFAEPYPHRVDMAKDRAGLDEVTAAEMVQLCMAIPMNAEPLDWESVELTALTAYVEELQAGFDPSTTGAANPCAANPCAANPCAANPCAANPCAANPCAASR